MNGCPRRFSIAASFAAIDLRYAPADREPYFAALTFGRLAADGSPVLETVRKVIADGTIGDLLEIRGRGKEDARGGGEDLWVLGSHALGMMRSIAGGSATSCFGGRKARSQHIPGSAMMAL